VLATEPPRASLTAPPSAAAVVDVVVVAVAPSTATTGAVVGGAVVVGAAVVVVVVVVVGATVVVVVVVGAGADTVQAGGIALDPLDGCRKPSGHCADQRDAPAGVGIVRVSTPLATGPTSAVDTTVPLVFTNVNVTDKLMSLARVMWVASAHTTDAVCAEATSGVANTSAPTPTATSNDRTRTLLNVFTSCTVFRHLAARVGPDDARPCCEPVVWTSVTLRTYERAHTGFDAGVDQPSCDRRDPCEPGSAPADGTPFAAARRTSRVVGVPLRVGWRTEVHGSCWVAVDDDERVTAVTRGRRTC
jgi:hypothetical protein